MVTISEATRADEDLRPYPPRKLQSEGYTGPITISGYERFEWVREQLGKEGIRLPPVAHRQLT